MGTDSEGVVCFACLGLCQIWTPPPPALYKLPSTSLTLEPFPSGVVRAQNWRLTQMCVWWVGTERRTFPPWGWFGLCLLGVLPVPPLPLPWSFPLSTPTGLQRQQELLRKLVFISPLRGDMKSVVSSALKNAERPGACVIGAPVDFVGLWGRTCKETWVHSATTVFLKAPTRKVSCSPLLDEKTKTQKSSRTWPRQHLGY